MYKYLVKDKHVRRMSTEFSFPWGSKIERNEKRRNLKEALETERIR